MSKLYQSFTRDEANRKISGFDCRRRKAIAWSGEGRLFSAFNLGKTTVASSTKNPNFVSGPYSLFHGKNRVKFK